MYMTKAAVETHITLSQGILILVTRPDGIDSPETLMEDWPFTKGFGKPEMPFWLWQDIGYSSPGQDLPDMSHLFCPLLTPPRWDQGTYCRPKK